MSVKWFGLKRKTNRLATQLVDYLAYKAPHTGDHLSLDDEQALENLAYLQTHRELRIDSLHALVARYGIDLKPALSDGNQDVMIEALYRWAQSEWAPSVSADVATRQVWRTTDRQGEEIIYSVVMDCAIALGEIVINQRPEFQWGVDLDADNCRDQMSSARRVVLQGPSLQHPGETVIVDWEEVAVAMLLQPQSAANRSINLWQRVCDECISGEIQGEGR